MAWVTNSKRSGPDVCVKRFAGTFIHRNIRASQAYVQITHCSYGHSRHVHTAKYAQQTKTDWLVTGQSAEHGTRCTFKQKVLNSLHRFAPNQRYNAATSAM